MHVPVHGDGGGRAELPEGLLMGGGRVVVVIKEGGEELGERDVLEVADDGRPSSTHTTSSPRPASSL